MTNGQMVLIANQSPGTIRRKKPRRWLQDRWWTTKYIQWKRL